MRGRRFYHTAFRFSFNNYPVICLFNNGIFPYLSRDSGMVSNLD